MLLRCYFRPHPRQRAASQAQGLDRIILGIIWGRLDEVATSAASCPVPRRPATRLRRPTHSSLPTPCQGQAGLATYPPSLGRGLGCQDSEPEPPGGGVGVVSAQRGSDGFLFLCGQVRLGILEA